MAKLAATRAFLVGLIVIGGAASSRAQSIASSDTLIATRWTLPSQPLESADPPTSTRWSLPPQSAERSETLVPTRWSATPLRVSLAASFVGLQALDVVTTLRGLHTGAAVEANPLVGNLANHPAALVAVKGSLTAATVASMNSLSKKHPKAAALAMIALNAGSALIVRSNLQIAIAR